jgi:hypothetical protein
MSLTPTRPSTKGSTFQLLGPNFVCVASVREGRGMLTRCILTHLV